MKLLIPIFFVFLFFGHLFAQPTQYLTPQTVTGSRESTVTIEVTEPVSFLYYCNKKQARKHGQCWDNVIPTKDKKHRTESVYVLYGGEKGVILGTFPVKKYWVTLIHVNGVDLAFGVKPHKNGSQYFTLLPYVYCLGSGSIEQSESEKVFTSGNLDGVRVQIDRK